MLSKKALRVNAWHYLAKFESAIIMQIREVKIKLACEVVEAWVKFSKFVSIPALVRFFSFQKFHSSAAFPRVLRKFLELRRYSGVTIALLICLIIRISFNRGKTNIEIITEHGAAEARRAHNPEGAGSKPAVAKDHFLGV